MPQVTFRGKVGKVYLSPEKKEFYEEVKVPVIQRRHCDMAAFRIHPRFGGYSNSDLFLDMIRGELRKRGIKEYIRLDKLPKEVSIDTSEFLAKVTIELE